MLDELKNFKFKILSNLSKDKFSLELFEIVFPQLKKIKIFSNLNGFAKKKIKEADFLFLLSVMVIDGSDNLDFFLYKFNISKKDQKRLKIIDDFYKGKISPKSFSEKNLNKIFYYKGKKSLIDILSFKIFLSKKIDKKLLKLIEKFENKNLPTMPFGEKINYKIVGKDEADLKDKLIYYQSPIGKGLIGKNKKDLVEIKTPAGTKNFEIKDVKYI